jgi:hypothetical protein
MFMRKAAWGLSPYTFAAAACQLAKIRAAAAKYLVRGPGAAAEAL